MASYQKYKTAKGEKWLFKMDVGINPLTGKKKRTTRRGFKTKKEAQIASASLLQDINNGTLINESKILFEDFIDKWFEHYKLTGVKNSTLANRKTTSIPNLKRLLGKYPISKIGMTEYQTMLNTLFEEDYADNTIIAIDVVAKLIFKYAVQLKYIRESPTLYAIVPKKVQSITDIDNSPIEEHYLEKNELNTFLNVIQTTGNKLDYAVFLTLSFTGMRIGELLALKWENIDFKRYQIQINKTLFRNGNVTTDYELTPPKTKKSSRVISVDKNVMLALSQLKFIQEDIRNQFPDYHNENFVFAKLAGNNAGYPELRSSLGYRLKEYLRKSKITKNITLHKLRHTHVSLLAEAGVELHTIQERIGHESSKTTSRIYLHVTKEVTKQAVEKFSIHMNRNS